MIPSSDASQREIVISQSRWNNGLPIPPFGESVPSEKSHPTTLPLAVVVRVAGEELILPVPVEGTVGALAASAAAEWTTLHPRRSPQRVHCCRDPNGRLLSPSLPLAVLQNNIGVNTEKAKDILLDVELVDWRSSSDADAFSPPVTVLSTIRACQTWAAAQLSSHLDERLYRTPPLSPEATVWRLIDEFSMVSNPEIQSLAVSLLTRLATHGPTNDAVSTEVFGASFAADDTGVSPSKSTSEMATTQLLSLLHRTSHPRIVITICQSLSNLRERPSLWSISTSNQSELEAEVAVFLLRFPSTERREVLNALQNYVNQSADAELSNFVRTLSLNPSLESMTAITQTPITTSKASTGNEVLALVKHTTGRVGSEVLANSRGRLDVQRCIDLLTAEGGALRSFALEKLQRGVRGIGEEPSLMPRTEQELTALVAALFGALKSSIHARPPQSATSSLKRNSERQPTDNSGGSGNINGSSGIKALTTAGRLIVPAFASHETDQIQARRALDILWNLFLHPSAPSLTSDIQQTDWFSSRRQQQANPLLGIPLTTFQLCFLSACRPWYRLLFTLSHLDEGIFLSPAAQPFTACPEVWVEMAERSGWLLACVILHAMRAGWASCALHLETAAITRYLRRSASTNTIPGNASGLSDGNGTATGSGRLFLALSYLAHYSDRPEIQAPVARAVRVGGVTWSDINAEGGVSDAESAIGLSMAVEILSSTNFIPLRHLWGWATDPQSSILLSRLAFRTLSRVTTVTSIAAQIWRLDPLPQLLESLVRAYRRPGEKSSFFTPPLDATPEAISQIIPQFVSSDLILDSDDDDEAFNTRFVDPRLRQFIAAATANSVTTNATKPAAILPSMSSVTTQVPPLSLSGEDKAVVNSLATSPRYSPRYITAPRQHSPRINMNEDTASSVPIVRVEIRLISRILCVLVNLLSVSSLVRSANDDSAVLTQTEKKQLQNYLTTLTIGPDASLVGTVLVSPVPLEEVARNDQTVAAYLSLIDEALHTSTD